MDKRTFGTFLTALRKANGMTQKELADCLSVSDKAVSRWERDETFPDLSILPVIADTFDVTVDELLRGGRNTADAGETAAVSKRTETQMHRLVDTVLYRYTASILISVGSAFAAVIVRTLFHERDSAGTLYMVFEAILFCVWLAALIGLIVYYMNCKNKLSGPEEYGKLLADGKKTLARRFRRGLIFHIALVPLLLMFLLKWGWGAVVLTLLIIGIPYLIIFFGWLVSSEN